ncbi:MAG: hypothetical protein AAFV32_09985 [Myxococcota bacterium]
MTNADLKQKILKELRGNPSRPDDLKERVGVDTGVFRAGVRELLEASEVTINKDMALEVNDS